jgi:ATP-binding cassette, subfamily B, bacterial
MKPFPFYQQLDQMDCGPTCLRMIAKYYGKVCSREYLREKCNITREGVSLGGISDAAEAIGMGSMAVSVDYETLRDEVPLPCIAHWRQRHFIVVYAIKKDTVLVADPGFALIKYRRQDFLDGWLGSKQNKEEGKGLLLLLEPTPEFYESGEETERRPPGLRFLLAYFRPYQKLFFQLFLGLFIGTILQLIFPFMTQAMVDYGINYQNLNFVYLLLLGQLMLFFSQTAVQVIRSWILLHIGSRVNISIISDFLIKLMKLPIAFFDSKMTGDILQRVQDHNCIEVLLSSATLTVLFSSVNLIIFGMILAYYDLMIFTIFLIGTALYAVWVQLFMSKRAVLDYKRFDQASGNQSSMIQLINGMQEIKLNNSERRRRWEWEMIQVRLFKIAIQGLALLQYQTTGATFINELKNILITFVSAKAVIEGKLTLGMMLSVQYIIGQLNAPINNFISFAQSLQDAKISLERLAEIHAKDDEEDKRDSKITVLPQSRTLTVVDNLSFRYGGSNSPLVLQDLKLEIPGEKVTAIVGASGSGKTTLLKLLLKFYRPTQGSIRLGNVNLENISTKVWREQCGVVMQDGYIFADTIARNITESNAEGLIDKERLLRAIQIANLEAFIESLPLGYNTRIGSAGITLSGGQNQRILIARAVYKDPAFLFFDEATSALDARNERIIMENLQEFYRGRTVLIIAHRLSTVRNADQIIVLENGRVIEQGRHEELTASRGAYYTLVKNQLELGT